jgi:uncharacterized protein (DUF58 family)
VSVVAPTPDHEAELAELLQEVRQIDVQSRRLVADVMSGGWHSVFKGAGLEVHDVREWAEGDDPRAVDWSVTARMGRPFVRTYVEEREQTVVFLLDLSASMTGGLGVWSLRQAAARMVACLALAAVRNGDKVGMVGFAAGVEKFVRPEQGLPHALRLVRDSLALPARSGTTDPSAALDLVARTLRRRSVVFLVSDFLGGASPGGGASLALGRCARRHDVVAVRLVAPEAEPPEAGLVEALDPESGRRVLLDLSSNRVRVAWRARTAAWRERTDRELKRRGVDVMDVRVPRTAGRDALARPILAFFRMRELRGLKR